MSEPRKPFKDDELNRLIINNALSIYFQPIFDAQNKKVLGYEALTRLPKDSTLSNPEALFNKADALGQLSELELHCREKAIFRFSELKLEGLLFLNVSPYTLSQKSHPRGETLNILKRAQISPEQVVIEITEQFEAEDQSQLHESLKHYRALGFKIAIDDLGTGYSGLKQWSEIRPDIVKIDRYFISGCHNNIVKRELIRTIFSLGLSTGVTIIAEGIEDSDEYLILEKMGMQYGQGYLLGRPLLEPDQSLPEIIALRDESNKVIDHSLSFEFKNLVKYVQPVSEKDYCSSVYQFFKKEPSIQSLAVIDTRGFVVGTVYKNTLADTFSSDYGHALYDKKPVTTLMENSSFTVDINSSIDDVSNWITDDAKFDHCPEFIVVDKGRYAGIANIRTLLKIMTEEKIKHAQHANPLTLLPGNIVIEQRVNQYLQDAIPFSMAYFDLNHFKPFNDLYGYSEGDSVIKLLADVLEFTCPNAFIGHVGGDDFVVLFRPPEAKHQCQQALALFQQRITSVFKLEHLDDNGYYAMNRKGQREWFSLLSLSCGIVEPDVNQAQSHLDVANMAAEAKKQAKKMPLGEVFLFNKIGR